MTLQELINAVNDGVLTIIDRPDGMIEAHCNLLHLANASDINAAVRLFDILVGETWLWQISYDNLAVLTRRDDPEEVIRSISLSPAHALLVGALLAWQRDLARIEVVA